MRQQLGALLLLMTLSLGATAHQQKQAITTMLFNPRTSNIEVMHRFNLHDAEHAVKQLFTGDADIYHDARTQQRFTKYVIERFSLFTENKEILLTTVGYELEGKHFWVYQEAPDPQSLSSLTVVHNVLRDIWQQQTNTLNIEGKGEIKTLIFTNNTEALSVSLTPTKLN